MAKLARSTSPMHPTKFDCGTEPTGWLEEKLVIVNSFLRGAPGYVARPGDQAPRNVLWEAGLSALNLRPATSLATTFLPHTLGGSSGHWERQTPSHKQWMKA